MFFFFPLPSSLVCLSRPCSSSLWFCAEQKQQTKKIIQLQFDWTWKALLVARLVTVLFECLPWFFFLFFHFRFPMKYSMIKPKKRRTFWGGRIPTRVIFFSPVSLPTALKNPHDTIQKKIKKKSTGLELCLSRAGVSLAPRYQKKIKNWNLFFFEERK